MSSYTLGYALALVMGAAFDLCGQRVVPKPDGTFTTIGSYTLSITNRNLYASRELPLGPPLPWETLRAEDDPESNWGPVSGGLQLCLRFERESYLIGEPILTSVLIRNASDQLLADALGIPGSIEFFVIDERGQQIKAQEGVKAATKRQSFDLWPRTQYKVKVPVSELFALDRPGLYTVTAHKQAGPRSAPNVIMSGIATIRILASKASNDSNANRAISSASASSEPSRIVERTTGQPEGTPSELTGTNASGQRNQPMSISPRSDGQSDSLPSTSESDRTQLGFASGTLRIGASVLFLLVTAALVYLLLRRARRA